MRTKDVKFGKSYLYKKQEVVTIVERISGGVTNREMMQSGVLFDGYHRTQKTFLLSNGEITKADRLKLIREE